MKPYFGEETELLCANLLVHIIDNTRAKCWHVEVVDLNMHQRLDQNLKGYQ